MTAGYGLAARPVPAAKCEPHRRWRALTTLIGVAALLTGTLSLSSSARAETSVRPDDARSGSLILKTEGDGYTDATRLGIDVDVTVSGPTLRARVTQVFRNTTNDWVEATYVYPLPDGGAVDTLKMVIGDRVVVGNIKERTRASSTSRRSRTDKRPRSPNRSDRTCSPTRSPISGPAKPCWCRSNIRSRCTSPAISSRCASPWWSGRVTTRRRWCRPSICAPAIMAGALPPTIPFRTAIAFHRRSSTRRTTRRSIPPRSASVCRRDFRSAK